MLPIVKYQDSANSYNLINEQGLRLEKDSRNKDYAELRNCSCAASCLANFHACLLSKLKLKDDNVNLDELKK